MVVLAAICVLLSGQGPFILPRPTSVRSEPGAFVLDRRTSLDADPGLANEASMLREAIGKPAKLQLPSKRIRGSGSIRLVLDKRLSALGPEGYRLRVEPNVIRIESSSPAGVFFGVQTLRQMLPTAFFGSARPKGRQWKLPCLTVEDKPRFGWRGAHLDVARHFFPKPKILRFLDLLAMHKMNVLHLHLTDDQGWRIEIKRYPKLIEVGSKRKDTQINDAPDEFSGKPHSGFYTQSDLREIVKYASQRHITVLPEIEMPGHSQAAIAAYPELGNTGIPLEVATGWGTHVDVLNVEESTVRFMQSVLDEVMAIFPSRYVHIGGDEAPKGQWKASERAQAKMKSLGLKNEEELQAWFISEMDRYLTSKGQRLIGWDEILEGYLAPGATVMSWRGEAGGIEAARQGHDVIMSPAAFCYFDQAQTGDPKLELKHPWGKLGLERLWSYEPIPKQLDAGLAKHVLGAQSALWTEAIPTWDVAEYQLFPRLSVFSEVLWSGRDRPNYAQFLPRLKAHVARLDAMGVRHHPIDLPAPPKIASWEPGTFGETFTPRDWTVHHFARRSGNYEVLLEYAYGDCRLDIRSVELVVAGKVIVRDVHDGVTGNVNNGNRYLLNVPALPPGAKPVLRVTARTDGGADSYGDIRVRRVGGR